ncbi:MAG TPA: aldehyde ferredoxin oxidoreductase C-terminal domain-containing protein [Syntrophorhabdaceae bacterium]|nr:aldehyde ferredoxin oxidoreductase C-terminal domain-containing protein [Syntrophorhabdaceae bacterium]
MEKILRINMGAEGGPSFSEAPIGELAGLGGRGLTSAIISKEVPPTCHPLGAENKLVIAPGLLSGTMAAMSGRISIGCKSPLTGGIKESNSGGQPAQVLARLGYAAIVLEGKPAGDDLYKIFINKDGVRISVDNSLKMLGNYALIERMKGEFGDKIACISIGQAGEMRLPAASVACTDVEVRPARHAGRGGPGAVMGSKGVKVIVLDDNGVTMRQPKDPDKFREANKAFIEGLRKHGVTGEALPAYGTNVLTNILNEAGGYPTYNFKEGRFAGASRISGETMAGVETERGGVPTHGCHRGCVIRCSGIYNDKDGHYLSKQPEYETVWAHGGNCGIDDMDKIALMDFIDDDTGLDTIEMGVTIGIAMEAGLLKFGDASAAVDLLREVGKGTPLGRIIGSGAAVAGKVFGVERVPVVKGQALPAYDPRAVKGMGVTYATSTMGADHTAGYATATNILKSGGYVDPLKTEGQVELSRNLQIATAAIDSTGMCLFIAFAVLDQPETFQALLDLLNSFYGLNLTADNVAELGKSILKLERDFNFRAGFTKEQDRLPGFFKSQFVQPHNVNFDVTDEELDQVFNF